MLLTVIYYQVILCHSGRLFYLREFYGGLLLCSLPVTQAAGLLTGPSFLSQSEHPERGKHSFEQTN
jgi:hypothetical protein